MMVGSKPEVSVVVPMRNEAEAIDYLISGLEAARTGLHLEVIFVNDGSEDGTGLALDKAARRHHWVRPVHHALTAGQSAAVHSGVLAARAPLICTMDGDGQNPPFEIPRLVAAYRAGPAGLVAGQRVDRKDSLSKRAGSRAANTLRRWVLGDGTHDTACGLKAFGREAFLNLPYFNHMHRFLPALFNAYGYPVHHLDVSHAERYAGRSNYTNLQRARVGLTDLVGVMWLIRRKKTLRPEQIRWPNGQLFGVAQHREPARRDLGGDWVDRPADVLGTVSDPVDHV